MYSLFANVFVLIMMLAILISLGTGLYYLLFCTQRGNYTYRALVLRIGLSLLLFLGLVLAVYMGWVTPAPPPL